MKVLRSSLGLLLVCLILVIGVAYKVNAAVIITAEEISGDVVFSTSPGGSLNLAGLTANCGSPGYVTSNNFITPNDPSVVMGGTFFLR